MDMFAKKIIHEKFPPGHKLGCPKSKYTKSSRRATQEPGIRLPDAPATRRKDASKWPLKCTYTNNHKNYLKMRGYDVRTVYCVNRHSSVKDCSSTPRLDDLPKGTSRKLPVGVTRAHAPKDDASRDTERHSLESDAYQRLIQSLDKELVIKGHIKADDISNKQLGKVLTKPQLQHLLTQESPRIPKAFYT